MKNWHLMEDEGASKKISIRPKPGPAISENAGIYWHFLHEGADVYNLVDRFVKRCLSTDLVVLAKNDPQTLYFKDKVRLYYTLNVLAQNMEWRHMGLMSSYIRSISRVESFGENFYDDVKLLNDEILRDLKNMGRRLIVEKDELFCTRHLRRFVEQKVKWVNMAVCPTCQSVAHSIKVDTVIARLDRRYAWTAQYKEDVCWINPFKTTNFFDFDVLEIGPCSLEDINWFCIEAGNDPLMIERISNVPIRLLPGVELEDQAIRNLEKVFSTKKSKEPFRF